MSFTIAVIVFVAALALSTISSAVMARRLDQATAWLGFPEGSVGLVTAIGADMPEVTSAIAGIMGGHHDLGLGVIFGSNISNLAAVLGFSAIVGAGGLLYSAVCALTVVVGNYCFPDIRLRCAPQ